MVGRDLGDVFNELDRNTAYGDVLLEVRNLTNKHVKDISFTLRKDEILGFSGLVGSGRTEIMRAIFGADPIESGEIIFQGKKIHVRSPQDAIKAGIGFCPEDRKQQGIIPVRPVKDNISVAALKRLTKLGFINFKMEKELAEKSITDFNIKTSSMDKHIRELSGGTSRKPF